MTLAARIWPTARFRRPVPAHNRINWMMNVAVINAVARVSGGNGPRQIIHGIKRCRV